MAKQKQFEKVLKVLTDASGGGVTKEVLFKDLAGEIVENRIATYIWEIRTKANVPVDVIKDGRKVIGYKIGATVPVQSSPAPGDSAVDSAVSADEDSVMLGALSAESQAAHGK